MREIKFRAWNGSVMVPGVPITATKGYSSVHGLNDYYRMPRSESDYDDGTHWNLMQYTGLKDKNGREIYEGDIIDRDGRVYEVLFDKGGFTIRNTDSETAVPASNDWLGTFAKQSEVIGNIWES